MNDAQIAELIKKAVADAVEHAVKLDVAWSQLAICGLAALVLLSMWNRGYRISDDETVKDEAIGWFAAGCGVWSFVGLVQIVRLTSHPNEQIAEVLRASLSIANSICLIAAGVHLDAYKSAPPNLLAPAIRSVRKRLWFWTILTVTPPFVVLGMFGHQQIVDVIVSCAILSFLG